MFSVTVYTAADNWKWQLISFASIKMIEPTPLQHMQKTGASDMICRGYRPYMPAGVKKSVYHCARGYNLSDMLQMFVLVFV